MTAVVAGHFRRRARPFAIEGGALEDDLVAG